MSDPLPEPTVVLQGDRVMRVVWVRGSDLLRGFCWCGVSELAGDPNAMWDWLADHSSSHGRGASATAPPAPEFVLAIT